MRWLNFKRKQKQRSLIGCIDNFSETSISGWLCDIANPQDTLALALDGSPPVLANQFCKHLQLAGVSNGRHGFSIAISPNQFQMLEQRSALTVRVENNFVELPIKRSSAAPPWEPAPWIDTANESTLEDKLKTHAISESEYHLLQQWQKSGYIILKHLIPSTTIDELLADFNQMRSDKIPLKVVTPGARGAKKLIEFSEQSLSGVSARYLDMHNFSDAAVEIMADTHISKLLQLIFNETPVAMQSLLFEYGTEQRAHMDFPYVHTIYPSYLAAAWVALEDATEAAGALFYYPESHRLIPKYDFGNGSLLAIGDGSHVRKFEDYLEITCAAQQLERKLFIPEKGDVLIWHAALVHGGSPRIDKAVTRKSIVFHYSSQTSYPMDRRSPNSEPIVLTKNNCLYYGSAENPHLEGIYSGQTSKKAIH